MLDIKSVLKEKGITVTELAQKLGITQITLSRNINGNPTLETLQKIANEIGVDIRDLFRPETPDETIPIYKKEDGKDVIVGFLKKD